MRVEFKQAVSFDGVRYSLGAHDVPQSVIDHPYFEKLLSAGLVVEPKTETVDSLKARNKALSDKIAAEKAAKAEEESLEELDEVDDEKPKAKKKK